ncbi:MAG TPA: sigma-70 family RNA polymerase sigma factor [Enhygromyxa sp.]|nr:sigma-70 family RNA polymerase sigma factor [Enhygromyxa sp.]
MPSSKPSPRPASDAELLDAWRDGDAEAGEALYLRHYRPVARFFRNKVGPDRVADLIQETFVASVEGRERIHDSSRFRAYLLRIAYRVLCRHLRETYRRPESELDSISVADVDPTPSTIIARAQEQRLLLEGLRVIPVNYQTVLELHYWEELTTNEIAEVLGIPPGTARSRLQRAREALEAAMASIARSREVLDSTLTRLDDWAADCGRELAKTGNSSPA